jgi:hypothetical protein
MNPQFHYNLAVFQERNIILFSKYRLDVAQPVKIRQTPSSNPNSFFTNRNL